MKILFLYAGAYLSLTAMTFAGDFVGIERDKALHASASFGAQVTCAAAASEIMNKTAANMACAGAVIALGGAVELGALGPNTFDARDIGANAIGVSTGALLVQWKF